MSGFPRVPSTRRTRPLWERFAVSPLYGLTEFLMAGEAISDSDVHELRALRNQAEAFVRAFDVRAAQAAAQGELVE